MTLIESLTVASLAIGILTVLVKVFVVLPLKSFIKEHTYPIQPHANGGRSLPDIAKAVDRIEKRLDEHINFHLKDE